MRARRGLIGPDESTSIRRQCELLGVSRSSVYYEPVEPDAEQLELMRRIDELHLEFPFYGSRSIARELGKKGYRANRKRVQRSGFRSHSRTASTPTHRKRCIRAFSVSSSFCC